MKIMLRHLTDATGKPVGTPTPIVFQSQLPPEQQRQAPKPRAKKRVAPPTSTDPKPVEMTDEQRAILEAEKRELVAQLTARAPRPAPSASHDDSLAEAACNIQVPELDPSDQIPQVPRVDLTASAAAAAVAQRRQLEADIKALESQLAAARLREKQAQQAALQAQQRAIQIEGAAGLAPYIKRLEHHRDEVARVQSQFGPILKEAARSLASGPDARLRQAKQDAYREAGLLGAKLGQARADLDDALRRVTLDAQSARPEHHAQAKTLAEAALKTNVLALETEVKSLVQSLGELSPNLVPSTTLDWITPPSWNAPASRPDTAFLGSSII